MNENLASQILGFFGEFEEFIRDKAPTIVKIEAINHFQNSFVNQGFTDVSLEKWKERKKPTYKNGKLAKGKTLEKWEAKNAGRAILVSHASDTKGVHLANSITGETAPQKATIIVDKPYAAVHNNGLSAGRPPGFTMPKRQFIGASEKLEEKIRAKIESEIDKLTKKF